MGTRDKSSACKDREHLGSLGKRSRCETANQVVIAMFSEIIALPNIAESTNGEKIPD